MEPKKETSVARREVLAGLGAAAATLAVGCGSSKAAAKTSSAAPTTSASSVAPPAERPVTTAVSMDETFGYTSLSEDELLEIHLEAMVSEDGAIPNMGEMTFEGLKPDNRLRRQILKERIVPNLKNRKLTATAVADADSPNYYHLGTGFSDQAFKLTPKLLGSVADANSYSPTFALSTGKFSPAPSRKRRIFGLRGCRLVDAKKAAAFGTEIEVAEAKFDHFNLNCVMGIWDVENNKICAFPATTVPHLSYMQTFRIYKHLSDDAFTLDDVTMTAEDKISEQFKRDSFASWKANMLGQGLHIHTIGVHLKKYKGCPTQDFKWFGPILRAQDTLAFRHQDWDLRHGRVGDNIHPTWASRRLATRFASAGCNLIDGTGGGIDRRTGDERPYGGPFLTFLERLKGKKDERFFYMMTSGREARLHAELAASGVPPELRRWRFGSSGPQVKAIQRRMLGVRRSRAKGVLDLKTHRFLVKWQQSERVPSDGVVTPKLLKQANVSLPG